MPECKNERPIMKNPRIVVSPADHGALKLWLDERTYTLPRCRDYAIMPERDAEKLRDQLRANGVLAVLVKMPESVGADPSK